MNENPEIVDDAFKEQFGEGKDMSRPERMNKRNEIVKQLVTTTYEGMTAELEQRAKETQEQELKERSLGLEGIEEAEDVDLCVFSNVCRSSPTNAVL